MAETTKAYELKLGELAYVTEDAVKKHPEFAAWWAGVVVKEIRGNTAVVAETLHHVVPIEFLCHPLDSRAYDPIP